MLRLITRYYALTYEVAKGAQAFLIFQRVAARTTPEGGLRAHGERYSLSVFNKNQEFPFACW